MEPAYLEVTRGAETGRVYSLAEGANSVGRSPQNNVVLSSIDTSVSGHHAIVYVSGDAIAVQDLASTNGIFVNEEQVSQRELVTGDVIGLGRLGPRLRLGRGDPRPAPRAAPVKQSHGDGLVTGATTRERAIGSRGSQGASRTLEMEQRLMEKRIDAAGMQELLKDGRRVDRILSRGNLGATGTHMLKAAYQAGRNVRKRWVSILMAVGAVSLVVIVALAVRAHQYRRLIDRGLTLEETLDRYEVLIGSLNKDPERNRDSLTALIARFDSTRARLGHVKASLRTDDVSRFYADTVEMMIDGIMRRFGEADYHIPPTMAQRVKHHLGVYTGGARGPIGRYLQRQKTYEPMIQAILHEKRLPAELTYVAMLESGYNPQALSHAGARGMWQFMPATGRRYGLRIDKTADERTDPVKATRAAAEYFEDLIAIFGGRRSVMLAMAAYNAGESRVMGALRKIDDPMRNRDFWYIYRMGVLAEETNEYIPRILALMIISENPLRYGFAPAAAPVEAPLAEDDFVELPGERR